MSPRRWLEKWPLRLRALVLVLGLLLFVAPSWHVCALGGHALHCSEHSGDGALRPVICYCRADLGSESARYAKAWPVKLAESPQNAPFCLARLLQTMPGQTALVTAPPVIVPEAGAPCPIFTQESALLRPTVRLRGRGPPLLC